MPARGSRSIRYASLFASFDGELSDSGHSYAGRGGARFSW
jgi:hypothetical protein